MATHSSILAWRIPWTEELVGYSPWGGEESDTTEVAKHTCTLTFCLQEACVCTYVYSFLGIEAQSARSSTSRIRNMLSVPLFRSLSPPRMNVL